MFCTDRGGGKVREIRVPGAGRLWGVVYCEERDVYVVGDRGVHCLWYIDAGSGAVVRQVGSEGSGEGQLDVHSIYVTTMSVRESVTFMSVTDTTTVSVCTQPVGITSGGLGPRGLGTDSCLTHLVYV